MDGESWMPYQPATFPTPPFPEFVSGHSTFSAAGATILQLWTGKDKFDYFTLVRRGSSKIEPYQTPSKDVLLRWKTFTAAADEAGLSRRYGGIHFLAGDLVGRELGKLVASQSWAKSEQFWNSRTAVSKGPDFKQSSRRLNLLLTDAYRKIDSNDECKPLVSDLHMSVAATRHAK
jgi:hypothetical protein